MRRISVSRAESGQHRRDAEAHNAEIAGEVARQEADVHGWNPLPRDGRAPEWVTVFPKTGHLETRDSRAYDVSAAALTRLLKDTYASCLDRFGA